MMYELIKKHIIAIVFAIGSLSTILGTAYAIDNRYLKVEDFATAQQIAHKARNEYEVRQLEDKIFELDFRIASDGNESRPIDKAMNDRLKSRLKALR